MFLNSAELNAISNPKIPQMKSKHSLKLALLAVIVCGAATTTAFAQSTWTGGTGNWSSDGNPGWNSTGVPNAVGAVADTSALTGTITVDGTYTVGALNHMTTTSRPINSGGAGTGLTVDVASGNALLDLGSANGNFAQSWSTNVQLNDPVEVRYANNTSLSQTLTLSGVLSGTGGLVMNVTNPDGLLTSDKRTVLLLNNTGNTFQGGIQLNTRSTLALAGGTGVSGTGPITMTGHAGINFNVATMTLGNNIAVGSSSYYHFGATQANSVITLNGNITGTVSARFGGSGSATNSTFILTGNNKGVPFMNNEPSAVPVALQVDGASSIANTVDLRGGTTGTPSAILSKLIFNVAGTFTENIRASIGYSTTQSFYTMYVGTKDTFTGTTILNSASPMLFAVPQGGLILNAENAAAVLQVNNLLSDVETLNAPLGSKVRNLVKTGAGTVILTNAANTYQGSTTVSAGTLSVTAPFFSNTAGLTVNTGTILNLNHTGFDRVGTLTLGATTYTSGIFDSTDPSGLITGTGKIVVGATPYPDGAWVGGSGNWSSLTIPGWNDIAAPNSVGAIADTSALTGTITVDGTYTVGTLNHKTTASRPINSGGAGTGLSFDVASGNALLDLGTATSNSQIWTTNAQLNDPLEVKYANDVSLNTSLTLSGVISGTAGFVMNTTNPSGLLTPDNRFTLALSNAANSFQGGIQLNNRSQLALGATGAAGTGPINLGVNSVITFAAAPMTLGNDVALAGSTSYAQFSTSVANGVITVSGNITGAASARFGVFASTATPTYILSGNNSGLAAMNNEPFSNTPVLQVDGVNALAGTVDLRGAGGVTSKLLFNVAGTFTQSIKASYGWDPVPQSVFTMLVGTKDTFTGTTVLNSSSALDLSVPSGGLELYAGNAAGTLQVQTKLTDGTATRNVVKSGPGTVILSNVANTYDGSTTVSAGTLSIGSPNLNDAAAVSVAGGAALNLTFSGNDIVGSLTLNGVAQSNGVYGSSNSGGLITGTGKIQVGAITANYSTWADAMGITGEPASGDYDHDGLSNLVEYALLNMNPTASSGPAGTYDSSTNKLEFSKNLQAVANGDVTYAIELTNDLSTWTTAPTGANYVNDGDKISYILPSGLSRNFARLKVVQIP